MDNYSYGECAGYINHLLHTADVEWRHEDACWICRMVIGVLGTVIPNHRKFYEIFSKPILQLWTPSFVKFFSK